MDEQHTYASPLQNRGDDLLIEDKDFAVVYNGSVGGTYDIMLKYTEQEVRDHITRYGTDRASDDVKEVAKDMAAEQFAELTHQRMPVFEMPNGDILYARYNRDKDTRPLQCPLGKPRLMPVLVDAFDFLDHHLGKEVQRLVLAARPLRISLSITGHDCY